MVKFFSKVRIKRKLTPAVKLKMIRKFAYKITMSTVIDKAKRRNIIISVIVSFSFFNLLKPFMKRFFLFKQI